MKEERDARLQRKIRKEEKKVLAFRDHGSFALLNLMIYLSL